MEKFGARRFVVGSNRKWCAFIPIWVCVCVWVCIGVVRCRITACMHSRYIYCIYRIGDRTMARQQFAMGGHTQFQNGPCFSHWSQVSRLRCVPSYTFECCTVVSIMGQSSSIASDYDRCDVPLLIIVDSRDDHFHVMHYVIVMFYGYSASDLSYSIEKIGSGTRNIAGTQSLSSERYLDEQKLLGQLSLIFS